MNLPAFISNTKNFSASAVILLTLFLSNAFAQETASQPLLPNSEATREMTGKTTHQYKFDVQKDEFFQARVEQKGLDVSLKLLDENGKVLAEMDSPNGKEGFEMLSFVADNDGVFILEVVSPNEKAEKGIYVIKRESSRTANEKDKRQTAAERDFAEAFKTLNSDKQASFEKLKKSYQIFNETGDAEQKKIALQYIDLLEMLLLFDEARRFSDNARKAFEEGRKKGNIELIHSAGDEILKADTAFRKAEEAGNKILVKHPEFVIRNPTLKNFPVIAKNDQVNVATFLSSYHQYLLEPEEQLKYAEKAVIIAKEAESLETFNIGEENKLLNAGSTLQHLASALKENNNPAAISYYEQTLAKYRELKKINSQFYLKEQEAGFLQTIAVTYSELCREKADYCKRRGLENYAEAIKLYEELKDDKTVATLLSNVAAVYYTEKPFESFASLEKSLTLARKIDDKELISQILFYKGSLFFYLGNDAKAKENFRQGLEIALSIPSYITNIESASMPPFEKRNRWRGEYARLLGINGFYTGLGEYSRAVEVAKENHRVAERMNEKSNLAYSLGNIAAAYRDAKDWQNAIDYYQRAIAVNREIGDRRREALNLTDIGFVQLELNKPHEALQSLARSRRLRRYQCFGENLVRARQPAVSRFLRKKSHQLDSIRKTKARRVRPRDAADLRQLF